MVKWTLPATVLSALIAVSGDGAMAATAPQPGTYSFSISNGHIFGPNDCRGSSIFYYSAGQVFLFWPGLGAEGATLRKTEAGSGGETNLRITMLPKTPSAGGHGWRGQLTTHVFPNDSAPNTGTWSAQLTFADSNSFLLHYALNAGGCTLTNDTILIRTGS